MLRDIFSLCDVKHFADNTAANGAAVKGYSSSPDLERLVYSFHMRLAEMDTRLWIEYVPSAANIADDPTREEFDRLCRIFNAERIDFVLPPLNGWES